VLFNVINGCESGWKDVTSGVPQGSILGPLLFIIFINDIDCGIVGTLSKFADDTKVLRSVEIVERAYTLQDDLHNLYKWSQDWQLLFNQDKCKCIHFGYNNMRYDYFLGGELIKSTELEKDL
jgi:ribonuclease P/MRP protein subunit RPP40